jgi:hypothetical protein
LLAATGATFLDRSYPGGPEELVPAPKSAIANGFIYSGISRLVTNGHIPLPGAVCHSPRAYNGNDFGGPRVSVAAIGRQDSEV